MKGRYAFETYAKDRDHLYYVYIFVVKGNGITAVVDTGVESVPKMNEGAGFLLTELMSQSPGEESETILEKARVAGADVDYVLLTHCHYDHCSRLDLFPKATVVVPSRAWEVWHVEANGADYLHEGFLAEIEALHSQGRLLLAGDEQVVVPGIGVRWVGGHCPCSQFVYVNTLGGVAVITGDAVQLYDNLTQNDPIGIWMNLEECREAIDVAREADVLVAGHDPAVMDRFPDGVIG